MTCPCSQPMAVPGAFPKAVGRFAMDRATLRRELGGVAEIREAMTAKETGRASRREVGAEWLLDAAGRALSANPPAGVDTAYVNGFLRRHRASLLDLVRGAFPTA